MISTKDEIMFKFAASQDDDKDILGLLPIPVPPDPSELASGKIEEPESSPISQREEKYRMFKDPFEDRGLVPGEYSNTEWPWEDPMIGSIEWMAKNQTKEYLHGAKLPYRGYVRDPQNDAITKLTMDRLVAVEPEKYFEWDLRRVQELKAWLVPATKALIDRDPYKALFMGVYKQGEEIKHLLPKLWKDVMELEFKRSSQTESGGMFPERMFNRMRSLAGELARINPEFYIDYIAETGIGQKFRTKQFDSWAANAMRDR